jgi:hypothetical protein
VRSRVGLRKPASETINSPVRRSPLPGLILCLLPQYGTIPAVLNQFAAGRAVPDIVARGRAGVGQRGAGSRKPLHAAHTTWSGPLRAGRLPHRSRNCFNEATTDATTTNPTPLAFVS